MLELRDVTKSFGGVVAVEKLSFHIEQGEIVGLIGPNGSGKTVTVNLCTGVYPPDSGTITFRGTVLNGLKPWDINRLGLVRTFQTVRLWGKMSVLENLMTAYARLMTAASWEAIIRWPRARKEEREARNAALDALQTVGMAAFADKNANDLSLGQQRLVELARVLVAKPYCILLDEPAAGLKAELVVQLGELLKRLCRERNLGILVVEHRTKLVMDICSRIIALNYGRKIAEGTPLEILNHEEVIKAYLGTKRRAPEWVRGDVENAPGC